MMDNAQVKKTNKDEPKSPISDFEADSITTALPFSSLHTLSDPRTILHLQRTVGNQAVQRLLKNPSVPVGIQRQPVPTLGVVQRDANQPVYSYTASHGVFVERVGQQTTITARLEIYGASADATAVSNVQSNIARVWNVTFPDGYRIVTNVTVTMRAYRANADSGATPVEVTPVPGRSNVTGSKGDHQMTLFTSQSDAYSWVLGHEFGHVVGLDDRYSDQIMNGQLSSVAHAGYGGNLMGQRGGTIASQNAQDLQQENAPSRYEGLFEDDDQIRAWVSRHSRSELTAVPISVRLQMIKTLMSGWIADEDVAAIGHICRSAADSSESSTIRNAVEPELLSMSSIGQRTRVRVFLSQMP